MTELTPPTQQEIRRTDRYTGGYLVFVCIRCTIQYILLPFVLPLLGLGLIGYNVVKLWDTSWRYRYLALSVVMIGILLVFIYNDLRTLLFA